MESLHPSGRKKAKYSYNLNGFVWNSRINESVFLLPLYHIFVVVIVVVCVAVDSLRAAVHSPQFSFPSRFGIICVYAN